MFNYWLQLFCVMLLGLFKFYIHFCDVLESLISRKFPRDLNFQIDWSKVHYLLVLKSNCYFIHIYMYIYTYNEVEEVLVAQSCLTLYDTMDCSPQGSSLHGILQARILEWVVISFSRGFSQPRDGTWVFHIAGRLFTIWTTREAVTSF